MVKATDNSIEYTLKQKNKTYYDCMSRDKVHSHAKRAAQENVKKNRKTRNKQKTFAQQEIHLSDLPIVPQGYETIAFSIYALLLPYGVGYLFLITFLTGASFSNNPFLNTGNFLIVWIVGYEVISGLTLLWIIKLFLQFDTKTSK